MKSFWALRIHAPAESPYAKLQQVTLDELSPGEVILEVHYSSINYKDALAATGKGRILRHFPLNGGIDAAGVVLESQDRRFQPGQKVLITGCGIGENFDGGYSEIMRVNANSLVHLPDHLSLRDAMIIGTAGFTAALALYRMQQNEQKPELGPIVVTGASGGVGSFAVQLFSQSGFEVTAVSGKHEAIRYLKNLGAHEVIPPEELNLGEKALERVRFGGAVDSVGGKMLSHLLSHIQLWGNVASIGLADSPDLHTTVMPFILRGVSVLGISSNNTPMDLRIEIWKRLSSSWRPKNLEAILTRTVSLRDLMLAFDDVLHRKVHGRILVAIKGEK